MRRWSLQGDVGEDTLGIRRGGGLNANFGMMLVEDVKEDLRPSVDGTETPGLLPGRPCEVE